MVNLLIFILIMSTTQTTIQKTPSQRLYSLDALRGFDMFWIAGGEEIFHSLAKITGKPFWQTLSDQFEHPAWNGLHFYDCIFPLFLFIAGVAATFVMALGTGLTVALIAVLAVSARGAAVRLAGVDSPTTGYIVRAAEILAAAAVLLLGLVLLGGSLVSLHT